MQFRIPLLATAALTLAACQSDQSVSAPESEVALSASVASVPDQARIPNQYIVVLKDDVRDVPGVARGLAAGVGGQIGYTYTTAIKGFSITVGSDAAAAALARNPNVAYVEQDQVVTASATQTGATWGLDRVDQRDLPLSGTYTYTATAGNVWAYIIDTGIRTAHTEFGGRASLGFDAFRTAAKNGDCNGHGTHVAGTVGGTRYGIAKAVKLVAVRVLDCRGSGSNTGVIAGVDWVANQKVANPTRPMVANMSLGGGVSTALDNAVTNAVSKGVTMVVAAGNSNVDACTASPARAPSAITVGSTTNVDGRSSFSNFGTCVDIFAPGSSITSAWHSSNTAINTISGTSMAAPHVAGVAALVLAGNTGATPAQVGSALTTNATVGKVTNPGTGSPNLLLFSNY